MSEKDLERRYYTVQLRGGRGQKTITGYAAVFNERSQDLGGFMEVIRPGAFRQAILTSDVRALWNHDQKLVLGRTKAGTLKLAEDDRGLRIELVPPESPIGQNAVEAIGRGDVDQMSFAFSVGKDAWTSLEDGRQLREILSIKQLFDVSPVTFPAYAQTDVSVSVRNLMRRIQTDPAYAERLRRLEAAERGSAWDGAPRRPAMSDAQKIAQMRRRLALAERGIDL
ncbi:MAG: HK97 family phage prohead protease [Rhodothermales bacterium]